MKKCFLLSVVLLMFAVSFSYGDPPDDSPAEPLTDEQILESYTAVGTAMVMAIMTYSLDGEVWPPGVSANGDPSDDMTELYFENYDITGMVGSYTTQTGTVTISADGSIGFSGTLTGGAVTSISYTITAAQQGAISISPVTISITANGETYLIEYPVTPST